MPGIQGKGSMRFLLLSILPHDYVSRNVLTSRLLIGCCEPQLCFYDCPASRRRERTGEMMQWPLAATNDRDSPLHTVVMAGHF